MRSIKIIFLLLVIQSLLGCSAIISNSGGYKDSLSRGTSRDTVHKNLGEPVDTFIGKQFNATYDVYILKGKISDPQRTEQHVLWNTVTLFLAEIIATPYELIRLPFDMAGTHKVTIVYDSKLKVASHFVGNPEYKIERVTN